MSLRESKYIFAVSREFSKKEATEIARQRGLDMDTIWITLVSKKECEILGYHYENYYYFLLHPIREW